MLRHLESAVPWAGAVAVAVLILKLAIGARALLLAATTTLGN